MDFISPIFCSGAVAKSVKILSLRLAANTPAVPAQKIANIGINLTVLALFIIKASTFN
tara:strand:- start:3052 stop:3225 length:174 start_codon:yes stop_codon:yes gene_type:complete